LRKQKTEPLSEETKELISRKNSPVAKSSRYYIEHNFENEDVEVLSKKTELAALLTGGNFVETKDQIDLYAHVQSPYKSTDLIRFENAARKNHAIKASFALITFFMFCKGSSLQITLPDYEMEIISKQEREEKIKKIKEQNKELLEEIERRDRRCRIKKHFSRIVKQGWTFGRFCVVLLKQDNEVKRWYSVNPRRLGEPLIDANHFYEVGGVIVDGQPLKASSMIYGVYNEDDLSPHTLGYGYAEIEGIAHVAEALNIALQEDIPEILKAAFLASVILNIQTAGLSKADAKNKITSIVNAVAKAGKIIGINEEISATPVSMNPNFQGLEQIVSKLEKIIFKSLQVPEFLLQSEAAANRATAIQAATQFLNGKVSYEQQVFEDILEEQWYDTYLMENREKIIGFENLKDIEDPADLPFHVRRVFNKAKVSDFMDMATAIVELVKNGIWDEQKANEELESEEVLQRIMQKKEEMQKQAFENQAIDKTQQISEQILTQRVEKAIVERLNTESEKIRQQIQDTELNKKAKEKILETLEKLKDS